MGGVGLLAWVPPVVPPLLLVFIFMAAVVTLGDEVNDPGLHKFAVAMAAVVAGILAAAVTQWVRHPDGARDWMHGGITYIDRDDPSQLGWVDWALLVTRRGRIHDRAGRLRLETSLFFGLVPVGSHEIKLHASDRASADRRDRTLGPGTLRSHAWDLVPGPQLFSRARLRSDHVVELVSADGSAIRLLDITTRMEGGVTGGFAAMMARRINQRLDAIDWEDRERKRPARSAT
jgi:hypothetical protein